jgi:hypothetical protein
MHLIKHYVYYQFCLSFDKSKTTIIRFTKIDVFIGFKIQRRDAAIETVFFFPFRKGIFLWDAKLQTFVSVSIDCIYWPRVQQTETYFVFVSFCVCGIFLRKITITDFIFGT